MKSVFEYLGFRRLPVNYISPACCEVDFSSTSEPSVVLAPFSPEDGPTGLLWEQDGGTIRLRWNTMPGVLCYSLYRAVDELDPYGEYVLVAECVENNDIVLPVPDGCGTFRVTGITPEGETTYSEYVKTECEETPGDEPYDTQTLLFLTGGDNPSRYTDMLTFLAQVIGTNPDLGKAPTGFIDLYVNGVLADSQPLDVLLQATFSTNLLPIGVHQVVARYVGDTYNNPSNSVPHVQTVNVMPGSACEQIGDPVPETFEVDIPDEAIDGHTFNVKFVQDWTLTVPEDKRGIYQIRYESGGHGWRCPDRADTPTVQYCHDCEYGYPAYGYFQIVDGEIQNWIADSWVGFYHAPWGGESGHIICANIDPAGWGLDLENGKGMCGWIDHGSQIALVTSRLTGGPDPDQPNFCWQSPRQLNPGESFVLRYNGPAQLPQCDTAPSGVDAATITSDEVTFSWVRVKKLIDQPATATVLQHPHLGNIVFTEKSYTENICQYFAQTALGYSLILGNVYSRKWYLYLPLYGGWAGEKIYGQTMLGNYQRTSAPETGPDCFVVV